MPPQTWEEIVTEVNKTLSADERKVFDNIVQKIPEFKEGRLRQADYSRQSLELQKRTKEYDDAVATSQRVQSWFEERKPSWDELVKDGAVDPETMEPVWPKEKLRLTEELEAAKRAAVAGGEMDPKELDKRVREIVTAAGGVTQEELRGLVAVEAAKMAEEKVNAKYAEFQKEFNEKTIPFNMGMSANNSLAAHDYEKVTGEEFTEEVQKQLFTLMTKENNFKPREVMKLLLKPAIEKKATEAEIERRAEERVQKKLAERGEMGDQPYIPQGDRTTPQGSLRKMLELSAAEEGDVESLTMAAGRAAAAELRAEGK